MDPMDQIAAAYVAPFLQPGEEIRWIGGLLQPTSFNILGVPQRYVHNVAVGTERRMLLTEAAAGFALVVTSAPLNPLLSRPIISWWYDELGEVEAGRVEGLTSGRALQLHPFEGCGPFRGQSRRYDAFASTPGFRASAMEGQAYFHWLADTVRQRAFPVDHAKEPYLAGWQQAWPAQRARRLKSRARGRRLKVIALALVVALVVSGFAFYEWETGEACLSSGASSGPMAEKHVAHWEQALADLKSGKPPPACGSSVHDECVCIDRAIAEKEPWLKDGRTKTGSRGELCYDASGIEHRLSESKQRTVDIRELVTTGERHRIAAVLLACVAVLGLSATIWKTRLPPTTT
jgi:hypothetical protein